MGCGGVFVVVFCGVFVVVLLWWRGGVFLWCFCDGVLVVVFL